MAEEDPRLFGVPYLKDQGDLCPSGFVDLASDGRSDVVGRPDRHTKLIIGDAGSGKTEAALNHPLLDEITKRRVVDVATYPGTSCIEDVASGFVAGAGDPVEYWSNLWHLAVTRSVASHLLYEKRWEVEIDSEAADLLRKLVGIFSDPRAPVRVSRSLELICSKHFTREELNGFYHSEEFERASVEVDRLLEKFGPAIVVLDISDEVLDNAPACWLQCLTGMMYYALDAKTRDYSSRIEVVCTVSGRVYRSAATTMRGMALKTRSDVKILGWRGDEASAFLHAKVSQLPADALLAEGDSSAPSIASWLGAKSRWNSVRNRREQLDRYLIRHSRRTPRHVVTLGNAMCDLVKRSKLRGKRRLDMDEVRRTVHRYSDAFAREMVMQCSADVVLGGVQYDAVRGDLEIYEGSNEDISALNQAIGASIGQLDSEVFTAKALQEAIVERCKVSSDDSGKILSAMWRHQLFMIESTSAEKRRRRDYCASLLDDVGGIEADAKCRLSSLTTDLFGVSIDRSAPPV